MSIVRGSSTYYGMAEVEGGHIACSACKNRESDLKPISLPITQNKITRSILRCECGNVIAVEMEMQKRPGFWENAFKGMFANG